MTPKYYTPEISEFHIGFEYEFNSIVPDENDWQKAIIKDGTQIDDIHREYKNGNRVYALRAKHLDREDIETLDWECKLFYQSYNSGEFIINNKYILIFNLIDSFCIIKHINFPDHVEKNIISIFQGTMKNKSELKKLMVQLGIN